MIPSNLSEICGVISVGLLAISMATLLYRFFLADDELVWRLREHLRRGWRGRPGAPRRGDASTRQSYFSVAALLIAIGSYGLGQILQDLTDHLTDNDWTAQHNAQRDINCLARAAILPSRVARNFLRSEGYHRMATLFSWSAKDADAAAQLTPLTLGMVVLDRLHQRDAAAGKATAADAPQSLIDAANGELSQQHVPLAELDEFLDTQSAHPSHNFSRTKRLRGAVQQAYYEAKNWCYKQPTYFQELEGAQRRIDFCRTCTHLTAWFLAGLAACVAWNLARLLLWNRWPAWRQGRDACGAWRSLALRAGCLTLGGVLLAWISANGYRYAEINFNERVFGYYASMLADEARKSPAPPVAADSVRIGSDRAKFAEQERPPAPPSVSDIDAGSVLWLQNAPDYRAACLQAYGLARRRLEETLKQLQPAGAAKPLAVVMDLDETTLDNSEFQAYLTAEGQRFSPDLWERWVRLGGAATPTVPGAREFIQFARGQGVQVIFVSNRPASELAETAALLRRHGLAPADDVPQSQWLRLLVDTSDKLPRFRQVQQEFHVVLWIGDQYGDFYEMAQADQPRHSLSLTGLREAVDRLSDRWGVDFIVLPNPMYGDWWSQVNRKAWRDELRRENADRVLQPQP